MKNYGESMQLVDPEIERYCLEHSSHPSDVCREIEEHTRANVPMAMMLSGPLESSLIRLILASIGARRILEIGTYTGYSALAMAEVLPSDGEVITCDLNPETTALAQKFWNKSAHGKKIHAKVGKALETINSLKGPFDFVFIDADKENYPEYFKRAAELIRINGIIGVDNSLWSGRVIEPNADASTRAIQKLNDLVAGDPRFQTSLVPIRDGLLLARRQS